MGLTDLQTLYLNRSYKISAPALRNCMPSFQKTDITFPYKESKLPPK